MSKKLTIEEIRDYVNTNTECILLSNEYINSYSKLKFVCEECKVNTFETSWNSFVRQNKHKCDKCGNHTLTAKKRKHTYKYVYDYILNLGGELLSKEYISAKDNISVLCPECNEPFDTTLVKIKRYDRVTCPKCNDKKAKDLQRYKYEDVKNYIENNSNCKLISTEYINVDSKLEFECGCENHTRFFTSFYLFKDKNKRQCDDCAGFVRWDIPTIKEYLQENSNCEILSNTYVNNSEKLKFKCECENEFEDTWGHMINKKNIRCGKCNYKESAGEKALQYEDVYNEIAKSGCELLSKEYISSTSPLLIKCGICNEREFETNLVAFRMRNVKACPVCNKSMPASERKFQELLNQNDINYIHQHKYDDCRHINVLKFDFYLSNYNIIIEVDGIGHFQAIDYFGGEERFELVKIRDDIKNKYCKANNIPLIRIPYNERNMSDFIKRSKIVIESILSGKFERLYKSKLKPLDNLS